MTKTILIASIATPSLIAAPPVIRGQIANRCHRLIV
jgi:hypothetical protein